MVGGGSTYPIVDGIPATQVDLVYPTKVAFGPDGSFYFADSWAGVERVFKVGTDGIIHIVAGTGAWAGGYSGDGGPATKANLLNPQSVAVGPDGSVYIADTGNNRIRMVGPDGIIHTVAGNGNSSFNGDGRQATQAALSNPQAVAIGPDGNIYIADTSNYRIRRIAPALPGFGVGDMFIPAMDGSEIYHFDSSGKHLNTIQPQTGTTLYQFTYDSVGLLAAVTDGSGNITTISHDAGGNPTAIAAPFGQKMVLATDTN